MSERTMRSVVIKLLNREKLDAIAVENPALPGTWDVNCILGWIELKQLPRWPVGAETPVRVDHFTAQQRIRLRKRYKACQEHGFPEDSWLLLQVKHDWLLFRGSVAAAFLGDATKEQLLSLAYRYWPKRTPTAPELKGALHAA